MRSVIQRLQDADIAILKYLNPAAPGGWVSFFQLVSDTTSQIAYGLPALLCLIGLLRDRFLLLKSLAVLAVVFLADYSALFLKNQISRQRPFEAYPALMHYSDAGNASFPSGHTTQAMAMAAAVILLFRRPAYGVSALAWAVLVGFSRVYLGVHYPSDVIGAMLLSWAVALPVFLAWRRMNRKRKDL
jgi:undecaprenyl-diphosphatase